MMREKAVSGSFPWWRRMVLSQEVEDGDKAILHEELLVLGDWAQSSSCMWAI